MIILPGNLMEDLWFKFTSFASKTILHPQYFLKSYEQYAIEKTKKIAKGILVDIGCGRQPYKKELMPFIKKYIGIDHPKTSLKYETDEKPDILADAADIPLPNNYCETVIMISVLEHLKDPLTALKEASRILKKDGALILTTVQCYPLHDVPFDYFRFSKFSLKELLEASGFKIITIKPSGSFPILIGQFTNVFLFYKIKNLKNRNRVLLFLSVPFILIALLIAFLNNLITYILSTFIKDDKYGTFSLHQTVIARKI